MTRVYLEHVREKTGFEFPPKSPWWAWALRHAVWVYNRFHVRADTRLTPDSKIRLKTYAQPVLPFGELGLARRPGSHLQKSQTQFVCGCWLGRDFHTDEHIVGSKAGVFRTRTVRRLTEEGCGRHGVDAVEDRGDEARQTTKGCRWREKTNPFGTRHCQQCPVHTENHHRDPPHQMRRTRQTNQRCRRWMRRAHQCRIQGVRPPHRLWLRLIHV